jgi:uncharacterized hydrophobic protein (TIGR00271 family)
MTTNSSASSTQPSIRFSRTISLVRAIALGSSVTIGLGIFILIGLLLDQAGSLTPYAYLLAMILFLPLVLSYAERAEATPGSGGVFAMVRANGAPWHSYGTGWLLLGGHLALIALLGWGASLYINISLERLFDMTIDARWLAPITVIVMSLNELIGTRGGWRLRTLLIYGSIVFLVIFAARSLLLPPTEPAISTLADSRPEVLPRTIALMAAALWGLNFVLDSRDELRNPSRNMLPALLVPVALCGIIGAFVAASELRFVGDPSNDPTPLATLAISTSFRGEALFEVIYVSLGLFISLITIDRAIVTMLRLTGTMVRDGFLPQQFLRIAPTLGTPLLALRIVAVLSALVAAFVPKLFLVGFVALAFLWSTALLNVPDIVRPQMHLSSERRLKLPFHPLFPVLAGSISLVLSFSLPPEVLLIGGGWVLLGFFSYLAYARRGGLAVRRREAVVGDVTAQQRRSAYSILVCIANPETAPSLIRAGIALAGARKGRVLVLKIATFPDQVPQHIQREQAWREQQDLNRIARQVHAHDIPVEVLVRLARSPVDGILSTAQEEKVNLMLLGWTGELSYRHDDLDPFMDRIVGTALCDVAVLRGNMPDTIRRVLVPTAGSPNSIAAMKLAQSLVDPEHGEVVALHLVQEVSRPTTMDDLHKRMQEIIKNVGGKPPLEPRVVPTDGVRNGILKELVNFDMVLLGASRGGILDQTVFGGRPVEVARCSPRPAILVKHYEGARRFWVRRAWEVISSPFPKPTQSDRDDIYQLLRRSAHPGVDFFIMIGLAGMIATLGLVLNSPAVIIGAMLVAPLMSPILAIAMSMVQGDLRLLRLSAIATTLGVITAVSVSIGVALIIPTQINTAEIISRTRPNLLDLLVALASGAAGGYAIGRKEVAASLPGIAIAAALVPPLGVVGYGTATGQIDIAGGSLLLFITNLIAIIFAASIIFLLLGFRPTQARMRQVVQLKFLLSLLALLVVSVPLAMISASGVGQIALQSQIDEVLSEEMDPDRARITDVTIERQGEGFVVHATIYAREEEPFTRERIAELQEHLANAVNAPVTLRATVLRAVLLPEQGEVLLPEPTPLP